MPGDDQSDARVTRRVLRPDHVEVLGAAAAPASQTAAQIVRPGEPGGPREPCLRQLPPCLVGGRTVSCFLPFLRRRDSTARPHRVAMRARNPCLATRFLFRGR